MEVPLMVLVAVLDVYQAALMEVPGAKRVTQLGPKLEKEERTSPDCAVAPTEIAVRSLAGL